jgi:hypothetical protein
MTINPALNAAILTAIDALQAESNIPATISLKALAGACQSVNATCLANSLGAIECELEHIIKPHPIAIVGAPPGTVEYGYSQAELEALS